MGWAYHFVDLTDEQKEDRRHTLDAYGALAQISAIVPILLVQLYFFAAWLHRRPGSETDLNTPSSPSLKHSRNGDKTGIRKFSKRTRYFLWWCGDDVRLLGLHLGTKGQLLCSAAWTAWLLLLCFVQTGDDYLHVTKRFGTVAASQLPFHYLLALKTPYSPLQFLTRSSHETLNSMHQLLGRIITALLYVHAGLYVNFYVLSSLLAAKLQEVYVIAGVAGIIMFTLIGTSSLEPTRRWNYRVFLTVHIALSTAVVPVLWFHCSHIRIYVYETAAVVVLNLVLRATSSRTYSDANISILSGSQLIEIAIPLPTKSHARYWTPGQHAYISIPGHPLRSFVKKNPFTLSSIPTTDGRLRFVARIHSGNTAALAAAATANKGPHRLAIEGPYGVATHPDKLLGFDRVLMVAGGVGGTFIVPLYRQLLEDLSPSKSSYRRQKVSAAWIARSVADISWALPQDGSEREGFLERLSVFVTGADASSDTLASSNDAILYDEKVGGDAEEDGIELEERANLLSGTDKIDAAAVKGVKPNDLPLYAGRPNLGRLVDQAFSHGTAERVAVVVCGPSELVKDIRNEVGRWVGKGREVWYWQEEFSL